MRLILFMIDISGLKLVAYYLHTPVDLKSLPQSLFSDPTTGRPCLMQREQCISSQSGKRYLLQPIYNLSILDLEIMLASCLSP